MSRVKDCQDILFELPNNEGIEFLCDMMTSKHAECASGTMLLILHLSWDIEWCTLLKEMKPDLEGLCLKLAAFALKSLLERVEELKEDCKKYQYLVEKQIPKSYGGSQVDED
eukprot:7676204-Ditylum_brightwellii.AAC.1